jgi:hypothetical protein
MCSLQDRYAVFCDGSYGTMYPSTGVRNGTSGLLGVFMAGKNSALPAMAPFGFYGPLQNHIGGWAITTCHDIRAYGWLPVAPFMAYTRGHRNLTVQNLHAVSNVGSPQVLASAEATCTDDIGLGNSPGQIGAVGAMYSGESLQKLDPKDPVGAYLEYPFFTCCHWCTGVTPQAPSSPMGNDIYTQTGGTIDGSPATRFNVIGRGMLVQSIYTEMQ